MFNIIPNFKFLVCAWDLFSLLAGSLSILVRVEDPALPIFYPPQISDRKLEGLLTHNLMTPGGYKHTQLHLKKLKVSIVPANMLKKTTKKRKEDESREDQGQEPTLMGDQWRVGPVSFVLPCYVSVKKTEGRWKL